MPNFGAGLHREPLFISAHMSLTTEAHSVVAIYNQPQMAATVITAVLHDSLGRLWKAWYHPRWRYGKSREGADAVGKRTRSSSSAHDGVGLARIVPRSDRDRVLLSAAGEPARKSIAP